MSFFKNKKIFWPNIIIYFCVLLLIFVVRQNSVKADNWLNSYRYSHESLSDFISSKALSIFADKMGVASQKYKQEFDLHSDYSLQKYIFDAKPLQNKRYTPSDLIQIDSEYVVSRAGRPYLRQPAQVAFEKMAKDFYLQLWQQFYLLSAYRSHSDQANLFEWWCSSNRCARIWASEHQLGLAVDIHLATKYWYNVLWWEYLDRLNQNAHNYGFINTYRKWYKIDGKMPEVWHRRYVWIPLATELFEKDLSFAEYYNEVVS